MNVSFQLGGNRVQLSFEHDPTTTQLDILREYVTVMRESTLPYEDRSL